jgi:hypothetical protein
MKRFLYLVLATLFAVPASAALKNGTAAPAFTTQASLGGKEFRNSPSR